jgi:hypothetical protein
LESTDGPLTARAMSSALWPDTLRRPLTALAEGVTPALPHFKAELDEHHGGAEPLTANLRRLLRSVHFVVAGGGLPAGVACRTPKGRSPAPNSKLVRGIEEIVCNTTRTSDGRKF